MSLMTVFAVINNPFPQVGAGTGTIQTVLNIVFGTVGAIALLVVIVGALQYIISNGDPQTTSRAKDTIIYAVVGLAIVIMAAAIVNFVYSRL